MWYFFLVFATSCVVWRHIGSPLGRCRNLLFTFFNSSFSGVWWENKTVRANGVFEVCKSWRTWGFGLTWRSWRTRGTRRRCLSSGVFPSSATRTSARTWRLSIGAQALWWRTARSSAARGCPSWLIAWDQCEALLTRASWLAWPTSWLRCPTVPDLVLMLLSSQSFLTCATYLNRIGIKANSYISLQRHNYNNLQL